MGVKRWRFLGCEEVDCDVGMWVTRNHKKLVQTCWTFVIKPFIELVCWYLC